MWADILYVHQLTAWDEFVSACFIKLSVVGTEDLSILCWQPWVPIFPFLVELEYSHIIMFVVSVSKLSSTRVYFFNFCFFSTLLMGQKTTHIANSGMIGKETREQDTFAVFVMRTTVYWV